MADSPCIVCTRGALAGARIALPEDRPLRLGRAAENDLVIPDDDASRFHCELLLDNGTLWLRDAGSRNGVTFRGARITQPRALKVGDAFEIGSHAFEIRWHDDAGDAPPARSSAETASPGKSTRRWWPFN